MREAVVIGAGSVGRGFVGQLFSEAGHHVTFLDIATPLVDALQRDGSYPHVTVSNAGSFRTTIGPVSAVDAGDRVRAVASLVAADVAATAVGSRALPEVADVLAEAISRRIGAGRPPLNVLLCENLHAASDVMRRLLVERLPATDAAALDDRVGLLETSIGRMIPAPDAEAAALEPTLIVVEPYKELPYDVTAVRGDPLTIPGLVADRTVDFAFYSDAKLRIHNMGHTFAAYLGEHEGATTIAGAVRSPLVRHLVRAAMSESALALSVRYGRPLGDLMVDVDDLIGRFGNTALGDTVERVGRDPVRKMAADDRFLGAYAAAARQGLATSHLSLAVAAGAHALRRVAGWSTPQVDAHLAEGLGGVMDDRRAALLTAQLGGFAEGRDLEWQADLIERLEP